VLSDWRERTAAGDGFGAFVVGVLRGARDDRLTGLAAEVAFFGALSVLPTLIAVAAALTLVPRFGRDGRGADVEGAILSWMEDLLTDQASAVVEATRELFDRSNGDIFTIALLLALFSGSRGIDAAVNAIVLVSNDVEGRPWWKRRLLSLGMLFATVVAGAIAASMFVIGPVLGGARGLADQLGLGEGFVVAWRWLRFPFGALAVTLWSVAVLHVARPHARSWRADLIGASVTTVLWVVLSVALRVYLATIGRSNAALGALGGPLIVMIWFYLLSLALLIGAEVAQQARGRGSDALARVPS
jgi:membrane protein